MTRSKVAAKYVNLVDRVEEPRMVPVPVWSVREVRPSVPQHRVHALVRELKEMFGTEASAAFDDRTLADLVGSGLLGE